MLRVLRILVALTLAATAQDPSNGSDFLVRVWQSEEGLPANVVRSLGQTSDGFLWVATADEVARFDGIEFVSIEATGPDRDRPLDLFRLFTPTDGSIWVSTFNGGLLKVADGTLVRVVDDGDSSQAVRVTHLFVHDGTPYCVRSRQLWTIANGAFQPVAEPGPPLAAALEADRQRALRRGRRDTTRGPNMLEAGDGGIWRIHNRALSYFPPDDGDTASTLSEFSGQLVVNDMLEGREGNLWLASRGQGLIRVRHRRVIPLTTRSGPYSQSVHTAIEDSDGTWWIANRFAGVDRIRDGVLTHLELTAGYLRPVVCIFEDSRGRLWFASRDGTLFEWVGDEFEPRFHRGIAVSKVMAIAEDSQGRLWFAGGKGLARWDGTQLEDFFTDPLLAGSEFSTLAIGADDTVFAGTVDGRLFTFNGFGFTRLDPPGEVQGHWISSILPLGTDELWVATIGSGLLLRTDGRWHRFGDSDGMPDERLTALTVVGDDTFWLGSLGGIVRTSRAELRRRVTNSELSPRWLLLDRSDGMATRECVGGAQPGVFRAANGTLWFPTPAGPAGVRPERISPNSTPPAIHLQPVEIDGVPYPVDSGPLVAGPGRARLGFRFTGLSLSAPEKVSYRIQLVGIDDEPRLIGTERKQTYEAVPPGRYTFEVTAMNGDGIVSPLPATVSILVRPHVWETLWFRASVSGGGLLAALSIGWIVARRKMKAKLEALRLRAVLQAERSRISSDLHDDLGASLTELSLLSALAAEDPDDSTLRPALDQLSVKAKRVVGTLDEIVWATNPTEDSLRSLIDYLAAFAREFLDVVQVPLVTEVPREIPDLMIGPRRRHNVLLTTREAINNAVKHAQPKSIRLAISIEDGQLVVRVEDDGKGFDLEYATSGDGLTNLPKRMTDCGGNCRIESVRGQGTTVTVTLPLPSA